jgi:hypothetical protein
MPIPVAKLREMQRPLPDRIWEFLSKHPDDAYSHLEIIEQVLEMTPTDIAALDATQSAQIGRELENAIGLLVSTEKVSTVMHNGLVYLHVKRRKMGVGKK